MSYFSVKPLASWPYVEVSEVDERTGAATPIEIEPPLIVAPTAFRVSPEADQAAFVYSMRQGQTPGLGNPNEPPPPEGIKVFSHDDAYLLFGGNAGDGPALYRRSGPTYIHLEADPLPFSGGYITLAAFAPGTHKLALVRSSEPAKVYVLDRGENKYLAGASLTASGNVWDVWYSEGGKFLCVTLESASTLYLADNLAPVSGLPAGKVLAISPDEQYAVVDDRTFAGTLKVYRFDGSAFSLYSDAPGTEGSNRRAKFSPDGVTLLASCATTESIKSPVILAQHEGAFKLVASKSRVGSGGSFDDIVFSADSQRMFHSLKETAASESVIEAYMRGAVEVGSLQALDFPATKPTSVNGQSVAFSPGGDYLAATGGLLYIYKREGSTFTRLTPSNSATGAISAAFSPDDVYLAVGYAGASSGTGAVSLFKRDGDTFTHVHRSTISLDGAAKLAWSPDGVHLALTNGQNTGYRMFKRSGDSFVSLTIPTEATVGTITVLTFSPDGQNFAIGWNGGAAYPTGGGLVIYSRSGDTFARQTVLTSLLSAVGPTCAAYSPDASQFLVGDGSDIVQFTRSGNDYTKLDSVAAEGVLTAIAFASNGSSVAVAHNGGTFLSVYGVSGASLTLRNDAATAPSGVPKSVAITPDGDYIATLHNASPYLTVFHEEEPYTLTTYLLEASIPTGAALRKIWCLSPEGDLLHFGSGGTNWHIRTSSPFGDVLYVPFEGDYEARFVSDVLYSPTGRTVIWTSPAGLQAATSDYDNQYTKFSRLNGVFVSVYTRKDDSLVEKGFVTHAEGSRISNIVFSKTPLSLSYFVAHDQGSAAVRGRHIFDTHGNVLALKGVEFEDGMTASFLAYSPFEEHFAVTYQYTGKPSEIVLYRFDAQLNYVELDREPVPFGPVAYSSCEDIVVAHGGTAKPFTIYKRIETELVEQPYPEMDWQHEGLILDIAFMNNCEQLVVVTPDKIVVVEKDEDGVEESDSDQTDGGEGDPQLDVRPDGTVGVTYPTPGGGGTGGGGEWQVDPGGNLVAVKYIPYATVHVTYRL